MSEGDLGDRIEAVWQRLQEVARVTEGDPDERGRAIDQLVVDLYTSLEELRVADAELRQQNAELADSANTLALERARYRSLFEHAPDPYLVTDAQGVLREGNGAAAAFLGVQAQFLVGRPLSVFVAAADHRSFFDFLARLGEESQPRAEDLHLVPRGGRRVPVSIAVAAAPAPAGGELLYRWLVRDVTERKRLEQDLASERDHLAERTAALRALVSQLAVMEETERRSFALALHDDLGQLLVAIKMKLPEAGEEHAEAPCNRILQEIGPLLAEAIEATRTLTRELSPPSLHTLGLAAALDELCETSARRFGLTVTLVDDGSVPPGRLPLPTRMLLFRCVRELLFNVHKHSGVTHATVSLRRVDDEIRVSVEDEGRGFDPKAADVCARSGQCFGLFSIAERVEDSGGRLEIDAAPGQGSRITMVVDGGLA